MKSYVMERRIMFSLLLQLGCLNLPQYTAGHLGECRVWQEVSLSLSPPVLLKFVEFAINFTEFLS